VTSGIDTESIISQMMAVERRPQDLLKLRVTTAQKAQTAWQAIADKLTALRSASDALAGLDSAAKLRTVTSSNPSLVSVRPIGVGANTSAELTVVALAAAHSVLAGDSFGAATDAVGTRTLVITSASGAATTITSADGTIGGLAQAVNAAGLGVSAKVLQTAPGQYQLSLVATATGTAASFSASGTGWTSFDTVRSGANAQVRVDGVLISRSSNVLSDVLDGVEMTLVGVSSSPATVASARDDAAISAKVKALVDAANALISGIGTATKTSTDAAQRGPLAGDTSARRIVDAIRTAIAQSLTTAAGATTSAATLGVSLNRDGTLTFDAAALATSLSNDSSLVLGILGHNAHSTAAGVTVVGALASAAASTHTISVTQAATRATLAGTVTTPPTPDTPLTLNIVMPTGSYDVSFTTGATWSQTADNLNAALRGLGVKLSAQTPASGGIDLVADQYGASQVFTVSGGPVVGLDGSAADGTHAAGTIDAVPFTANGNSYTTSGLVLKISTTATQITTAGGSVSGTVNFTTGLAGSLTTIGAEASATGSAVTAKQGLQSTIDELQKRVTRYDDVMRRREQLLRSRFTAMETMIQRLQTMTNSFSSLTGTTAG
jgi:flagellar hook-associated protein 2